jgi:SET domain-containing protein
MDPRPPIDVWAHPALVVRPSRIAGDGLFATTDLSKGELVLRLGGRLVSTAELDALIAEADASEHRPYVDSTTVFDDAHLVLPSGTVAHFANHSCDPSVWHDGAYDLRARRDIPAGEELTIDYGTNSGAPGFEMSCTCGARRCRARVSSDDWMIPELQRRYRGHWVPALARRIGNVGAPWSP